MMPRDAHRPLWGSIALGGLVTLVAFLGYRVTASMHFSGDSLMHAAAIRDANVLATAESHRLLMNPLGWLYVEARGLNVGALELLTELQGFNALSGALAAGILCAAVFHLSGRPIPGLLAAAGLVFSHASWLYSTDAEMVMPAIAVMVAGLWLALDLVSRPEISRTAVVASALLSAFAVLLYAQSALLVPVSIVALLLAPSVSPGSRWRRALAYLCTTVLFVVLSYTLYMVASGVRLGGAIYGGQGSGTLYGVISPRAIPLGAYAFLRSMANYPELGPGMLSRDFLAEASLATTIRFGLFNIIVAILVVLPAGLIAWRWRRLTPILRNQLCLLLLWALLNAGFALYWMPKDLQFWLPVTASWWLFVGLFLAQFHAERMGPAVLGVATAVIALLGWSNYDGAIGPRQVVETNKALVIASSIPSRTDDMDLLITVDDDRYTQYFSERRWLSLYVSALEYPFPPDAHSRSLLMKRVGSEMQATWRSGGRVFLREPDGQDSHAAGVARELEFPKLMAAWLLKPAWTAGGVRFVEVLPGTADPMLFGDG